MKLERTVKDGELILSDGSRQVLSIRERRDNDTFIVELTGSLKSDTVHEFQDEMEMLLVMGFALKIDMKEVSYISAACADILLDLQLQIDKKGQGSLTLVNVPAAIMDELRSTGMADLLLIE